MTDSVREGCTSGYCPDGHCAGFTDCPHAVITKDTYPELWSIIEQIEPTDEPFVLPEVRRPASDLLPWERFAGERYGMDDPWKD